MTHDRPGWPTATSGGAVGRSLSRATTTSFGSLCVGSLILSILKVSNASWMGMADSRLRQLTALVYRMPSQTLRQMVRSVNRDEEGGGCLACIAEVRLHIKSDAALDRALYAARWKTERGVSWVCWGR